MTVIVNCNHRPPLLHDSTHFRKEKKSKTPRPIYTTTHARFLRRVRYAPSERKLRNSNATTRDYYIPCFEFESYPRNTRAEHSTRRLHYSNDKKGRYVRWLATSKKYLDHISHWHACTCTVGVLLSMTRRHNLDLDHQSG